MTSLIAQFEHTLLSLDRLAVKQILDESQKEQTPLQFIEGVIVPALEHIGAGWEQGKLSLSQVYMGGRMCEELVDRLLPPGAPERKHQPRMAIAVLEDYHLLGKRIVYSVLRASGFELADYGRRTADEIVALAMRHQLEAILISTLMLPSAKKIKEIRKKFADAGTTISIIVGGAPFLFDAHLWEEVGADAMGRNASEAVEIVSKLVKK